VNFTLEFHVKYRRVFSSCNAKVNAILGKKEKSREGKERKEKQDKKESLTFDFGKE
jgi:hypothetical protein